MSKHTPGPWYFSQPESSNGWAHVHDRPNGYGNIATVWSGFGCALENARLIAAAPDLLAAIADMEAQGEWHGTTWAVPAGVWRAARAAITKATGEAA